MSRGLERDDEEAERVARQLTPEAKRILTVVVEHSKATSPDGIADHGHNKFAPHFNDPEPPYIECGVCGARLPL